MAELTDVQIEAANARRREIEKLPHAAAARHNGAKGGRPKKAAA